VESRSRDELNVKAAGRGEEPALTVEPDGLRSNRPEAWIRLCTLDSGARFSGQVIPPDPIVVWD
jgi:hypothetical protein